MEQIVRRETVAEATDPAHATRSGDLLDAIVEADRELARATAVRASLIARAHADEVDGARGDLAHRAFRAELAAALRIPEPSADRVITESRTWSDELPATLAALEAGAITPRHARILAHELRGLEPADRADLEARALNGAWRATGEFARCLRRWRDRRHPATAVDRHREALARRHVTLEPDRDGMAWLSAYLPLPDAVAIDTRLHELARGARRSGDPRSSGQVRADVFADVLLSRPSLRTQRFEGIVPTVILTVPAETAVGHSTAPGRIVGGGLLDPRTARELVAIAPSLRRMLTEPGTDAPLALGRTRYRPSEELRLWIAARDEHCAHPGCTRPAVAGDVDHVRDWAEGGATDAANLTALCRGHHLLKHGAGWRQLGTTDEGVTTWRSPRGRLVRSARPGADP